jgi:hypothetical protein
LSVTVSWGGLLLPPRRRSVLRLRIGRLLERWMRGGIRPWLLRFLFLRMLRLR